MPRYEHTDGTSWAIEQNGPQLVIDAAGKQAIRKFVTVAHAETQLAKLTAEKLAAGFALALTPTIALPVADLDAPLLAEIEADPYDGAAYAVLGDALQRRGDPRGELIALMSAAAATPNKKARGAVPVSCRAAPPPPGRM